jgi:hypothetical protein
MKSATTTFFRRMEDGYFSTAIILLEDYCDSSCYYCTYSLSSFLLSKLLLYIDVPKILGQ